MNDVKDCASVEDQVDSYSVPSSDVSCLDHSQPRINAGVSTPLVLDEFMTVKAPNPCSHWLGYMYIVLSSNSEGMCAV